MNDANNTITLLACCCIVLTIAPSASADFVGVTTVTKDDPETDFQCTQGNGAFVPGPLTVCNVYAKYDDPTDRLLSVGNADLQVYNGAMPDVFFQHPLIPSAYPPACLDIPDSPDLICDSFVAFGPKCYYDSWEFSTDGDFNASKFAFIGHIVGGWHSSVPDNGQGDAGTWPDLQVLFLQSSVAQGLSLSGDIDVFWKDDATGDIFAEQDLPIECVAVGDCQDPADCDDGNACTDDICADGGCSNPTISCPNDGNECTDDLCDPDIGCVHIPNDNDCDDGDACTENDQCGKDGCVHGTPVDCSVLDDQCNYGVCNPDTGECEQVPVPDGTSCDDGNLCTISSECTNGECVGGPPVDCDDYDACTNDFCDPVPGCYTEVTDCDDGDACTIDSCDPEIGCTYEVTDCDDSDFCTDDSCDHDGSGKCMHTPTELCDDGNLCTEDGCDSETGCTHEDIECPAGQVCEPATGECVVDQDPCECVDDRVTVCHIPPGNPDNAHTITVGCAARDKHLAHGDHCGPCEDGDG